jgi:hypothetical protein
MKPKLDQILLHTLFQFAQDYLDAEGDSGREMADKAAYGFVSEIHLEDIHIREIYTEFYESEKNKGLPQNRSMDRLIKK